LSSLPSHRCRPIVVVIIIVSAAITVHFTIIVVAIIVAILVAGVAAVAVADVAFFVDIAALSLSCLSCSLAVNPRNLTEARKGGIAHGTVMESALELAVRWPKAMTGRHLVHDVVLSGIS